MTKLNFLTLIASVLLAGCMGTQSPALKAVEKVTPLKKQLTVNDVVHNADFFMSTVHGTQWTPDGNGYVYLTRGNGLSYYDVQTGEESVYIDAKDQILDPARQDKRFTLPQYYWSPADQNHILVPKSTVDEFGKITSSDLYLYNRETKKMTRLTNDDTVERDPLFSPDGKKIAFLKHQNLFVLDIASKKITQLTTQGTEKILIGRFDWVYEEEFGIRTGFFWSPKSDQLAYFELTDAKTDRFPIVDFVPVKNSVEYLPYPKAGADNSTVRIGVVAINNSVSTFMDVAANKDQLIPRVKWTNDNNILSITKMNRDQDYLELYFADSKTGKSRLLLKEEEANGWIDVNDDLTFVANQGFIWKSRRNGYSHLYFFDLSGNLRKQLTDGKWEITAVNGVDLDSRNVFFTAAKNSPLEREFYSVDFEGSKIVPVSSTKGFHNIDLSPNNRYFLDYFSTVSTAPKVDLMRTDGTLVRNLRTNTLDKVNEYNFGTKELLSFKSEEGLEFNAYLIKPSNFDPNKKYPVMMFQYSGPGSQQVSNSYGQGTRERWHHYLAQNEVLVFCMDGRGTGFRGREFEQITNHNLGDYETRDQVSGAAYLRTLPYVEKNKIGIWGWSYGGYMSSLALMKYPEHFNLAIAVAPVTDWRNYDTIYTERFMSTPEKNKNYAQGAPMHYANQLNSPFLLVHGTGDDNVHLSNAVQLVHELVKNQKQFDHFFYPRSMHGLTYDYMNTYPHLFTMMSNFVFRHFK